MPRIIWLLQYLAQLRFNAAKQWSGEEEHGPARVLYRRDASYHVTVFFFPRPPFWAMIYAFASQYMFASTSQGTIGLKGLLKVG